MISPLLSKLLPPWGVLALFAAWVWTGASPLLAIVGLAATAELFLWAHRIARAGSAKAGAAGGVERFLTRHPLGAGILLVVFGVLIDLARMVVAVFAFGWWLIGAPAVMINRQRFERARALRLQATAQAVLAAARTQPEIAAGASLQQRALATLSKPLGLRAPEAPPERVLERAPVLVEAAPAEAVDTPVFRTVNGITEMLVASKADGAVYEPLPSGDWLGDR